MDDSLTYSQLSKRLKRKGLTFELHHRVPRYRLKDKENRYKNCGKNIMLLTRYEHVVAHYYLTKFEERRWYYSALMAFIQISSLKKEDIDLVTDENIKDLAEKVVKARQEYFGSEAHIKAAKKAGIKAGNKRKERMQSDPEFREYILDRMINLSPEQKQISRQKFIDTVKSFPPWERGGAKKKLSKVQDWKYAEAAFNFISMGFSYKKLSLYYGIEHERVSNIFRVIREDYSELKDFRDWVYYKNFIKDFKDRPIINKNEIYLFCTVPWRRDSNAWVNIDKIYEIYKEDKSGLTYTVMKTLTNPSSIKKIREFCEIMCKNGIEDITEWGYHGLWMDYCHEFSETD